MRVHPRSTFQAATAILIAAAVFPPSADAACIAGAAACPFDVQMAPGSDSITLAGTLSPDFDCCAFALRVRAAQTLKWSVTGATVRTTIVYPNGDADGPGLPATIPLPAAGLYVFSVRPNLMAEGAFGPFVVTFTIR
jgi:hypothetical protein